MVQSTLASCSKERLWEITTFGLSQRQASPITHMVTNMRNSNQALILPSYIYSKRCKTDI